MKRYELIKTKEDFQYECKEFKRYCLEQRSCKDCKYLPKGGSCLSKFLVEEIEIEVEE